MADPSHYDAAVPDVDALQNGTTKSGWVTLDAADPRLQAVNEAQEFSPDLLNYMKTKWDIADRGFDYNVVAVFGSQSTGKSTLLNRLFGTNFDVMNETTRQQTTKGIWVSKAREANLLVLDVEGTDGRERGEDQDFERKSALFSLAIAEVLIINMWETQVGLYNGANMGLLKTVFEVNLQLFQQKGAPKTCLFFVIRDFTGRTPIQNLQATLMKDLERMWAGLVKPAGKEGSLIGDFFEVSFAGLPHKIFASEKFEEEAQKLKQRFYDKNDPGFAFNPIFHKHIPADGFPKFAESIWEKIVSNRDLDLPTQQQLLAQYRCDEIMRVVYEGFNEAIKGYRTPLEAGKVLEHLGKEMQQHYSTALDAFDKDGSRYNKEVYLKKRNEFMDKMATALHIYYVQQLRNLHKKARNLFTDRLAEKMKGDDTDFARKLAEARREAEKYYARVAEATKLIDAKWSGDEYFAQFQAELEEIATEKRTEAMNRVVKNLEKFITQNLIEPIEVLLNDGPSDLWEQIIQVFNSTLEKAEEQLRKQLAGFNSSPEEISTAVSDMKIQAWDLLQKTINDEMADVRVIERLRHKFETQFRYDDAGLPRVWKHGDDIDGPFAKARDEADELVSLYSKITVPVSKLDPAIVEDERFDAQSFVILSPAKLQSLRDRFKREADLLFVEAKRSIVVTTAKIPPWFIVMTVILGWNEFMAVLSNPLYFLMLILMAAGAYATWYTGMTRPVYNVAKATFKEIATQAGEKVKERTGVDVGQISGETLLRNSTTIMANATSRLQREFTRSSSSPALKRFDDEGETVEMLPAGRSMDGLNERRRTVKTNIE